MIKKVFFALVNLLSVLIIAGAIVVLCVVLMTKPGKPPQILGYTALRITTGSMEPTLGIDTLIIVKEVDPATIQKGDIISFYSSDPALDGMVNTHRVTSVTKEKNKFRYQTKGDGNNSVDLYDVSSKYLIGKVVASSNILGKISRLAANPLVFIPIILVPLAIILLSNLIRIIRLAGVIAKEEEEEAVKDALRQIKEKKEKESRKIDEQQDIRN